MVKPDPLLFAHACRTLGGAPAHGAMVGDRYDRDIRGALDAGLYTIWLNGPLRGAAARCRPSRCDLRLDCRGRAAYLLRPVCVS